MSSTIRIDTLREDNTPLGQDCLTKLERTRVSLREQGKVLPETDGSPGSKTKAYEYLLSAEQPLEGLAKLDKARQEAKSHITQLLGLLESAKSRMSEGPRHLEATEKCTFTTPGRSTYTLVRTDVLAAKGKEGAAEKPSKREIVVFECSTRLSVSGGVSFATLDERRYKFVAPPPTPTPAVAALTPGSIAQDTMDGAGEMTTTPNVIALDRFSGFRVVPMVPAHIRVWDKGWLGIHGTFGAGVETGGDGLDIEFLTGVSFSIADALFITPGVRIGRVDSLVDGFQAGTPQPMGLSDPPIRRSNATAFGIALSWKFPPSSAGSKSTEKK